MTQGGAPAVPTPLHYEAFNSVKNICKIIRLNQINAFGFTDPTAKPPDSDQGVMACAYADKQTADAFSVGFQLGLNGLSGAYTNKSQYKYWMPVTVQGYPAVIADLDDRRKEGSCTLLLGVTNDVQASITWNGQPDPAGRVACQKTQQVADAVISNLKIQK